MNDWHDRFVDAALQELHGSKPPDLSARVLASLQEAPRGPLPRVQAPAGRLWPLAALLCAAVLLGFAAAFAAFQLSPVAGHAGEGTIAVGIDVLVGRVACTENGRERTVAAGAPAPVPPFLAAPGNRLRADVASSWRLDAFGLLVADTHTELEVRSMEFTKKHGIVAASSLTLAVVAGVVTWHSLTHSEAAGAGEVLRMQAGGGGDAAALVAENDRLRRRLEEVERQNQGLLTQVAQRDQAPAVPPPAPAVPAAAEPAPPVVASMAFTDERFADALGKIDWAKMGEVTHEMGPLLAELAAALAQEGAEMPMELAIKVSQLNGKLLEQVPALLAAKVPGFGANGSYTHPLVVANTLASTLAAAGQSLTPAQRQQIDGLVRSFTAENQAIADAAREFPLEQLLVESEMKDRFFKEVGSLLAPAQQTAMHPEGAASYEGAGLFSTGLMMRAHADPVSARDAADFARIVSGKLGEHLGLDDATAAQVRAVVARAAVDPALWQDRAAPAETSQAHFLRSGRTQAALRAQLQWMRAIQQQVPLTAEQKKKLGSMTRVLVPLPR